MKRETLPLATPAPARSFRLPTLKQVWFQLHWFIGITAGTVLVVIGLTGALLAFRDELTDLVNPGVRHVPVQAAPVLTPQQVAQAARAAHPEQRVSSVILYSAPGSAARVGLAALPGQPRGTTVYVHPYSGAMQPELHGEEAFETIEFLHRWLLLPREAGRPVLGTLAICLLGLALSGLYLRWPRRVTDWRAWLTFDWRLSGRPFLWALHSVAGTWALVAYVVFTLTGAYWSFDIVRSTVDGWAGVQRAPREAPARPARGAGAKKAKAAPVDLAPAWNTFVANAPGWQMAFLRFTDKPGDPVQIAWLPDDAPHPRARSRMSIAPDGALVKNEPYAEMATGARAVSTIYPLHMGTYFGLPGRIVMFLASLALPGFAVTGWMLYLKRRRQAQAARAERARLAALPPATLTSAEPVLVAYASQTGQAERLALHAAGVLQGAGIPVAVRAVADLAPGDLAHAGRALFIASSYGEGEPPDSARRFARAIDEAGVALPDLQYAVLALGDRVYAQFCGYGHALDRRLAALGGRRLFPVIEVDNGDAAALGRWSQALAELAGIDAPDMPSAPAQQPWQTWRLATRELLNPGSLGGPLFEIALTNEGSEPWQAGALAEIMPRHADSVVAAYLAQVRLDGQAAVQHDGATRTLADVLADSVLPDPGHPFAGPQECADALKVLAPRRYSIASVPADGAVHLLVRQVQHEQGLGLASGWLTVHATQYGTVRARLLPNPGFAPVDDDVPCIFIGNGSGLAGLRGHLRQRVAAGRQRNWLLFGERQAAFDSIGAAELQGWAAGGFLPNLDLVYSRDGDGYVQDRLRTQADIVRDWVADGAVLYVCGSLEGMAGGVDAALGDILGRDVLDELAGAGRYRRDVY